MPIKQDKLDIDSILQKSKRFRVFCVESISYHNGDCPNFSDCVY